jgi:SAM-dependent methyltransferase
MDADKVSEFWGRRIETSTPAHWLEHPTCRQLINKRATGDANKEIFECLRRQYLPEPADLALSLGSGFGAFDRMAIKNNFARRIHAFDLSTNAVAQATTAAEAEGLADRIQYSVADLNSIQLPSKQYDAVFAIAAVHHIFQLEDLFKRILNTMKPNAIFILDEYIGPSRFQMSPVVTELINRIISSLPKKYRLNLFAKDGSFINDYNPPPISWFEENDPSESVRSGEIVETLRMYFDIVEYKPYGGGILQMLLSGIAGNFDPEEENDVCILTLLSTLEEFLERAGAIESTMAAIICRAK